MSTNSTTSLPLQYHNTNVGIESKAKRFYFSTAYLQKIFALKKILANKITRFTQSNDMRSAQNFFSNGFASIGYSIYLVVVGKTLSNCLVANLHYSLSLKQHIGLTSTLSLFLSICASLGQQVSGEPISRRRLTQSEIHQQGLDTALCSESVSAVILFIQDLLQNSEVTLYDSAKQAVFPFITALIFLHLSDSYTDLLKVLIKAWCTRNSASTTQAASGV